MKRIGLLLAGALLLWVALVVPAWFAWREDAVRHSAVALGLCLVPALSTMAWVSWSNHASPNAQLLAVLGSSGIRMGLTLGGGLAVHLAFPDDFPNIFWGWLAIFYLAILSMEIILLLKDGGFDSAACTPKQDQQKALSQ